MIISSIKKSKSVKNMWRLVLTFGLLGGWLSFEKKRPLSKIVWQIPHFELFSIAWWVALKRVRIPARHRFVKTCCISYLPKLIFQHNEKQNTHSILLWKFGDFKWFQILGLQYFSKETDAFQKENTKTTDKFTLDIFFDLRIYLSNQA